MKQVFQSLKTGDTELVDLPCPQVKSGCVLIKTTNSLISAGTERMLLEFGKAGWIEKAKQQPDKVRMVLDKVKTDGLLPTIEAVTSKLNQPLPLGYCNVGEVVAVGSGVHGFKVGDRVLSNGNHAEVVCVPKNLCVRIPDGVADEQAVFGVLGAIALQGIRLVKPELGEAVVIMGLGIIGLLLVQLLKAHGCRVLGVDFDADKLALARQFGAETVDLAGGEDPIAAGLNFSRGRGVDAVLIAAASKSNDIVHQAAEMSRKRGRIVLVGVVGLELSRADFFEKEISFQVSCSYGPGRYDVDYETKGNDYPFGYVRWTEQRNFEAVLDMMADGRVDALPLISHRFKLQNFAPAYGLLTEKKEPSLGIILQYGDNQDSELLNTTVVMQQKSDKKNEADPVNSVTVGFIGAGNYASRVLMPAFKKTSAALISIVASSGLNSVPAARKYNFVKTTTDVNSLLQDSTINTVVIATQHDSHADLICRSLRAGKKVFVEKPLAINKEQLQQIEDVYAELTEQGQVPFLMVGFNRRFSPQVQEIKRLLAATKEPKVLVMTVNAGFIPRDTWVQDPETGGGRIIGEGCHMIDLLRYLVAEEIVDVQSSAVGGLPGLDLQDDQATITIKFKDGSIGTVHYLANGHSSFPKERLEVFAGGKILQLDNFRKLKGYGWPGLRKHKLLRQDKGNAACVAATVAAILAGQAAPIAFPELIETTQATFKVVEDISC